ncbi:hypothetical protein SESBI_07481 [Sesbania bispinosa]|nr:hypothetical protein SESBI_07481 [Sesbania bispinosa]
MDNFQHSKIWTATLVQVDTSKLDNHYWQAIPWKRARKPFTVSTKSPKITHLICPLERRGGKRNYYAHRNHQIVIYAGR